MDTKFDIIVAGAGPAGTLTAILLSRQGYSVGVVASPRGRGRIEGFSQRTVDILATHGLTHAYAAVGPMVDRIASWAGELGARNREYVTDRAILDEALIEDLANHNIEILSADIVSVASEHDHADVQLRASGTDQNHRVEFFVEARGRAAPAGHDKGVGGPPTTAIVRQVRGSVDDPRTAVAGFAEGWAWYVADGSGPAYLQIFVDSQAGLPKRAELAAFFESRAAQIVEKADWLGERGFEGPVKAYSAAPVLAKNPLGERHIRVGDAACALDPLSGNGMFAALGGAAAASPVIHTLIEQPDNSALARAFYLERARDAFDRFCRVGRDFYRLETRWPDSPFWHARQVWPDDIPAHEAPLSGPLTFARKPVVEDGFITEREVCVTPDYPRGIWLVDQVPIPRLYHLLAEFEGHDLPEILPEIQTRLGRSPRQLATAIDWLRYRRVLESGDTIKL
jgi:2-polyprenyl-6-methoxyphenol hydroxylase-like FAD-dependent oxidoreductase